MAKQVQVPEIAPTLETLFDYIAAPLAGAIIVDQWLVPSQALLPSFVTGFAGYILMIAAAGAAFKAAKRTQVT